MSENPKKPKQPRKRSKAKKLNIDKHKSELPFVYIYERKDFATTFYGLWIHPEWIKKALFDSRVNSFVTGKFTMITKYDKAHNQFGAQYDHV